MSLIPREETEYEKEDSGPVGGKRGGDSFGPEKDPKGHPTQEDSGPVGGNKSGDSGFVDTRGLKYEEEESAGSRDIGHPARVDKITP